MNRLPVLGIAFVVAAILSVAPASADPFLVTSMTQGSWTPSLPSLTGWTPEWHGSDFDEAPLTSLGGGVQSFSVFSNDFPQLNRGGQAYVSSGASFGGGHMSGSGGVPAFNVNSRGTNSEGGSHESSVSAPAPSGPAPTSGAAAANAPPQAAPPAAPTAAVPSVVASFSSAFSGKATSAGAFHSNSNSNASFAGASSVVTPEPASFLLFGSGLAFAGVRRLRRRRS